MRRLGLTALLACWVPAVHAQGPVAGGDDPDVTMQVIVDPNAQHPDDIIRKIPPAKPRRPGEAADAAAKDLDNPRDADQPGSGVDPGIPVDPVIPVDPSPVEPPTVPDDLGPGGSPR